MALPRFPRLTAFAALCVSLASHGSAAAPQATPEGRDASTRSAAPARNYDWFDPIIETRLLLANRFIDPADDRAMQEAALAAMVASLGDPYSVYVPPAAERDFDKSLRGSYVGIGAEIDTFENYLRIVTPLEDSPALRAGVLSGDLVLEIDGESTLGKSTEECMEMLLGEEGTPVTITVRHSDGREDRITIVRARIETETVKGYRRTSKGWEHILDRERGIGYLRLTQFTETSADAMLASIDDLRRNGLKALVLDLRFNGGGSLGAAIQIADLFLAEGAIVSVRDRDGKGRAWSAAAHPTDVEMPMVILVNEGSASASEVLAGALQENARAKVLGTRTFGKGSVQDVISIPADRGTIKITTARYYLPSGRNITRSYRLEDAERPWGVDPDPGFHLPMTDDQERSMFIARRAWEIPDGGPSESARWADPAWIAATPGESGAGGLGDLQLAGALTALRTYLDEGTWPRVGDDPGTQATVSDELQRARGFRDRLLRALEETDARIAELAEYEASAPRSDPSGGGVRRVPKAPPRSDDDAK